MSTTRAHVMDGPAYVHEGESDAPLYWTYYRQYVDALRYQQWVEYSLGLPAHIVRMPPPLRG